MASEIRVKVGLLTSAVSTGLAKVRSQFHEFRSELNSEFGSFVAFGSLVAGFESLLRKGREIQDTSERFSAPVGDIQRITNVAEKQGATLEDVARSWNKLEVNRQKAIDGNDEVRKTFTDLGISMEEVVKMPVSDLFYRVADAVAGAKDRGDAYASTVALMGRNAGALFSTMEQGGETIKRTGDAIGVMSDEGVEQLDAIDDAITKLKNQFFVFGGGIVVFVKKVVESVATIVSASLVHVEGLFSGIGTALSQAIHGHFSEAGASLKQAFKDNSLFSPEVRLDFKNQLSDIWKTAPKEAAKSERKKPFDPDDIQPGKKESEQLKKVAELRERLAEIQRKANNEELDTQAKIQAMIAQRAALLKQAAAEKDVGKQLELQIKAAEIGAEIFQAQKSFNGSIDTDRKAPSIAADQFRRVGGGGNAAITGVDSNLREQKIHTKLLQELVKNTAVKKDLKDLKMK